TRRRRGHRRARLARPARRTGARRGARGPARGARDPAARPRDARGRRRGARARARGLARPARAEPRSSAREAGAGGAAPRRRHAVTQNLANVGTAGYKAGRPVFRLHPLDVEEAGLPAPPALRAAAQVTEAETVRDFSQGPVHATGNPLDVAVTGEGFFVVATPRGERYTRQG